MVQQNGLGSFSRGHYEEHFCEFTLNLGQWLRRLHLKIFLFLALATILFSRAKCFEQFYRGHYEEHFWEFILILDQWFWWHYVTRSRTICATLVEGIMGNISVK